MPQPARVGPLGLSDGVDRPHSVDSSRSIDPALWYNKITDISTIWAFSRVVPASGGVDRRNDQAGTTGCVAVAVVGRLCCLQPLPSNSRCRRRSFLALWRVRVPKMTGSRAESKRLSGFSDQNRSNLKGFGIDRWSLVCQFWDRA